jgi:hypothetical protein
MCESSPFYVKGKMDSLLKTLRDSLILDCDQAVDNESSARMALMAATDEKERRFDLLSKFDEQHGVEGDEY